MGDELVEPDDDVGVVEYDSPEDEPIDELDPEDAVMDVDGGGAMADRGNRDNSGVASPAVGEGGEDLTKIRLDYPLSLPYTTESLQDVHERLDEIMARLSLCAQTGDFSVGLPLWTNHLQSWFALKYPASSKTYAKLARFYLELSILPGMEARLVDLYACQASDLLDSKRWLKVKDLTLEWRPLYQVLKVKLFPKARTSGVSSASVALMGLAEACQRFFPADSAMEMLDEFLVHFNANSLNAMLTTQAFIVSFLPLERPHEWLHTVFALWNMANSNLYSEQWLDLLSRLAKKHVDAPLQQRENLLNVDNTGMVNGELEDHRQRQKIRKEIGIFTHSQMELLFDKCLGFAGVPVGSSRNPTVDASKRDQRASEVSRLMKKPSSPAECFASIFVYSIFPQEGVPLAHYLSSDDDAWRRQYGSPVMLLLRRFIEATESFMHPSNYGTWSQYLSALVSNIAAQFLNRWQEEKSPKCKTPLSLRLTPALKRDLVFTLRGVSLLGLFSQDPITKFLTQTTLKSLGALEPNMIYPELVERAYPALQGLLETERTTSILSVLGTLANGFISQEQFPAGGKHLFSLLEHMLPAVDVNDPVKTMYALMFCAYSLMGVPISDVSASATPPNGDDVVAILPDERNEDGELSQMTPQEDIYLAKLGTRNFEEWISNLLDRIFNVYSNLPEEGKGANLIEKFVISTIDSTMDIICQQSELKLFNMIVDRAYTFVTTHVIVNATRPIGSLIKALTRAHPELVCDKFLPICYENILQELDNGASSTRSTKSENTSPGDSSLQWHQGILTALVNDNGQSILKYREKFLILMRRMREDCKAESGYAWSSSIIKTALLALLAIYPKDYRSANPKEWNDAHCDSLWGKTYEAKDVKIDWHVPSDQEIAMAIEILHNVAGAAMSDLETLISTSSTRDSTVNNDFCRNMSIVRYSLEGSANLIQHVEVLSEDALYDAGRVSSYLKSRPLIVKAGFCLTDESDPRYQTVLAWRARVAELLHRSVDWLSAKDENVDSIKMTIRAIKAFTLHYGVDRKLYDHALKGYTSLKSGVTIVKKQKLWPRRVLVRRAAVYHMARMRMIATQRPRTATTDILVKDILKLSISSFVQIRKAAQNVLTDIAAVYDGTRALCYPILLDAIKPGQEADQLKGALWTLGTKAFGNLANYNWSWAPLYAKALLELQHEQKPSIQTLTGTVVNEFIVRIPEPFGTDRCELVSPDGLNAFKAISDSDNAIPSEVMNENREIIAERLETLKQGITSLSRDLLDQSRSEEKHWRYRVYALRMLRALLRRDVPLDAEVASFAVQAVNSELPSIRSICTNFIVKMLHFAKIRALAGSDPVALVQSSGRNPYRARHKIETPINPQFTAEFLQSLTLEARPGTLLHDETSQGWLIWGSNHDGYLAPLHTGHAYEVDKSSIEALDAIRSEVSSQAWWKANFKWLSQESSRPFSSSIYLMVKSIFQVYEEEACLDFVLEQLGVMIRDRDDKHKQRAAAEVLSGVIRGSKHWPFDKSSALWAKVGPMAASALENTSPETLKYWEDFLMTIASKCDPRRIKPIVDLITSYRLDQTSNSAFAEMKKQEYIRCLMTALNWHFLPWSKNAMQDYWANLSNPFQEVRTLVAANLALQIQTQWHPSYPSATAFVENCQISIDSLADTEDENTIERIRKLARDLDVWRKERQPTAMGTSTYNLVCKTVFTLVYDALLHCRRSGIYSILNELLPEFFYAQEILDDSDLQSYAKNTLQIIARWPMPKAQAADILGKMLVIAKSEAWRIRLHSLGVLQVFFFYNLFLLDQDHVQGVMQSLGDLLLDSHVEVRTLAATTLSGLIRCSQRLAIKQLRVKFERLMITPLALRKGMDWSDAEHLQYQEALRKRHAGVLGMMAIIGAYPYDIPDFMPDIIAKTFTHITDPNPISTTIRDGAASFKKTHSDTWHIERNKFTSDQLEILNDTLSSGSYLA